MMKKITLYLAALLPGLTPLWAQEEEPEYRAFATHAIRYLDPTRIPYGTLYEKVQPLSNLDYFVPGNDSSCSNTLHFFQAIHELDAAHLDPETEKLEFPLFDRLQAWEENHGATEHPLALLFSSYGSMLPYAVDSGLIGYEGDAYYDIAGKMPYREVHSLVASSLSLNDFEPGSHTLYLDPDFILGTSYKKISKLKIDTKNGDGWQQFDLEGLSPEEWGNLTPIQVLYDDEGSLMVDVSFTFEDNSIYNTHFNILFSKKKKNDTNCFDEDQTNDGCTDCIELVGRDGSVKDLIIGNRYPGIYTSGYHGPDIPAGNPEGVAYYFYANEANFQARQIRKPVIFIDGYDPTNTRCAKAIYTKYINKHVDLGGSIGQVNLAQHIRNLGYDLIVLDFKEGGRHIEENAMVVKKLLEELYADHSSTMEQDFVLIGPSMGALIAQFALTYMEKVGSPHHVRTWISFDGPHQGANVAKSVTDLSEYLLKAELLSFFASGMISNLTKKFYTNPAAQQMIIHHPSTHSESPAWHSNRDRFLNNLSLNHASRYPQQCRNVAIVNGSLKGQHNQFINNCSQYGRIKLLRQQFPYIGPGLYANCEYKLNATTYGARCQNATFYTLWPLGNMAGIPMGTTNKYSTTNGGLRGLDAAPGSSFGAIGPKDEESAAKLLKKIVSFMQSNIGTSYSNVDIDAIGKTTFIPTVSAVDYKLSNDVYTNLTGINLTKCAGNTPFNKIYGNDTNSDHVAVDATIAQAFIDEITGKYDGCPIVCSSKLNGAGNRLCTNQQITLTLDNNIPANSTILWEVSSGLTAMSAVNANNYLTVKSTGNNNAAWVKATITPKNAMWQTCSAPIVIQSNFASGSGSGGITISPIGTTCNYQPRFNAHATGNIYSWSLDGATYTSSGSDPEPIFMILNNPSDNGRVVYCKVTNACGTIFYNKTFIPVSSSGSPCTVSAQFANNNTPEFRAEVYPNPALDYWTVQVPVYINNHFTFTLFDVNGRAVFVQEKVTLENSNYNIAANTLTNGIYLLKIKDRHGRELNFKLIKN